MSPTASISNDFGVLPIVSGVALFALFGYLIYLVFFHPLAKVPGPKLYAISIIPYMYHLKSGKWHRVLKDLHDQYGPVVRIAPGDVSFINGDAWKIIYGHKNGTVGNFHKDTRFFPRRIPGKPNILTADESDHKRIRRHLSHAFSEKALRGQESIMQEYVNLLIRKLSDEVERGAAVDMVKWYNFTTFDLIGDLAFGEPFGSLESGGYHPWVAMIFDIVKMTSRLYILKRIPGLISLTPLFIPWKLLKDAQHHYELCERTAAKRIETGNTDREDFMSYMLRHNDEKGISTPEILETSKAVILAGSETTATLLSGCTYQMLSNRHVYERLVKEIRSTFNSPEEITISSVANLEYTAAVLNESLRIYPPVPGGMGRFVPEEGTIIDGYWIPGKTIVSVPHWAAYHSEYNFVDADAFLPERWLGGDKFARDAKTVFNPFSAGPRNCIGKNLAYAEMRLILVHLIWRFDMELIADSKDWFQQEVYHLWQKGKLNVKLTHSNQ
uniref:Cytochrome P450 n=1 Tax=Bionectria ochroleuca TaxID=29856 RepID=A0A8H7N3W4_BIOOC